MIFNIKLLMFADMLGKRYIIFWYTIIVIPASHWLYQLMPIKSRPENSSQLSCSLARKSENFCGKYVIYAEKMQNIRRKCIEINSFYRNSKKSIEKLDGSQHSQNIFAKPREIFQIISASSNNFLQLGC